MVQQYRRHYGLRMAIYVFRSDRDRRQFAFATDGAGAGLPENLGPWYRMGNSAVPSFVGMPASFQDAVAVHGHVVMQIARKLDPAAPNFRVRYAA